MVGAVAQLGEHLLCKQGVSGSIPLSSTNSHFGVEMTDHISFEEIKSLHIAYALCLFCKNREEKIDLEASRFVYCRKVIASPSPVLLMPRMT
jgi:hypothetical protein